MARIVALRSGVVEIGVHRQLLLVRIEDDDGLAGYGEATLAGQTEAVATLLAAFGATIVGEDPTAHARLRQRLARSFWRSGATFLVALAGVDIAMWDLAARRLGVPLHTLLGGAARDRIRVYTHLGGADHPEVADNAQRLVAAGYRSLKSFSGLLGGDTFPPDPVPVPLAAMAAARDAVGPEIELSFDCHGRFGFQDSLRMARGLAELQASFIEEPLSPENGDQYPEFCRRSPTPVAYGERLYRLDEFADALLRAVPALIQPDVMSVGGITPMRAVGDLAWARKVAFAPHNSPGTGPVAAAAALQLAAASPGFEVLETKATIPAAERHLSDLDLTPQDGYVPLPSGPGLGIEIDWDRVVPPDRVPRRTLRRGVAPDGSVRDW